MPTLFDAMARGVPHAINLRLPLDGRPHRQPRDTIMLVPGLGYDKRLFGSAFRHPSLRHATLVSFDWPGQGDTCNDPPPPMLWNNALRHLSDTFQQLCAAVAADGRTCHIVAHDMGTIPALTTWRTLPEQQHGAFIAIEGTLTWDDCTPTARRLARSTNAVDAAITDLADSEHQADRDWAADLEWCDVNYINALAANLVTACKTDQYRQHWHELDTPHYLYGAQSGYPDHHRDLFGMTDTHVGEIRDAGHVPMTDNRYDTWAAVARAIHDHRERR